VNLRLHGTRAEVAEATRRLLQVPWSNRPLATQPQLTAPGDRILRRWSG
jgi:hypothetical protein